ncbi:hypothetical protein CSUI_004978 [Cystoisospora suis]|uniref:Uncharacterized protein n=1 Tax=Cystoisospora suis TaxID=483139 RepID=A0A2C6KYP1_9APIC|nr:hypothetical protein CSUI_004978 [Cystoisospora suis]
MFWYHLSSVVHANDGANQDTELTEKKQRGSPPRLLRRFTALDDSR